MALYMVLLVTIVSKDQRKNLQLKVLFTHCIKVEFAHGGGDVHSCNVELEVFSQRAPHALPA